MINLPSSEQIENAVLGTLFNYPNAIYGLEQKITPDYFYISRNNFIAVVILELHQIGKPTDLLMVHSILRERNQLDQIGGLPALQHVLSQACRPEVLDPYIIELRNFWFKRKIIIGCSELILKAKNCSIEETQSCLQNTAHTLSSLLGNEQKKEILTTKEVFQKMLHNLEKISENPDKITGIPSGLKKLDDMTGGFHKSDLIIVGARPAMGKTAFALTIAASAALANNNLTVIFSLEMSNVQLVERIVSAKCRIDASKFRTAKFSDEDFANLNSNVGYFQNEVMLFDENTSRNIFDITAICRKIKMERGKVDMIIIDYLQLMSGTSNGKNNREREVAEITRGLKILAKELECPVIALSQLNRDLESRIDKRPKPSDLRESGAVEQDSDLILLLYRHEIYDPKTEDIGIAEVIIAKNRRGETGTIHTKFEGQYLSFSDLQDKI